MVFVKVPNVSQGLKFVPFYIGVSLSSSLPHKQHGDVLEPICDGRNRQIFFFQN